MIATHFLATVLGWYLVIFSLFLIIRHDLVKRVVADVLDHYASQLIVAIMTIILGLLMVVSHNLWIIGWPVIITIFAWLVLISGIVRLFLPDEISKVGHMILDCPAKVIGVGLVLLIIGLFLLWHVYFMGVL